MQRFGGVEIQRLGETKHRQIVVLTQQFEKTIGPRRQCPETAQSDQQQNDHGTPQRRASKKEKYPQQTAAKQHVHRTERRAEEPFDRRGPGQADQRHQPTQRTDQRLA